MISRVFSFCLLLTLGSTLPKQGDSPSVGDDAPGGEMPYTVIKDYGSYQSRLYPSANMVCTSMDNVDQALDPLAAKEEENPWKILQWLSNMWKLFQKTPESTMFMRLFRYIQGVNQEGEEVDMTKPVTTLHKVISEDSLGNVAQLLMCFYLPSKYQPSNQLTGGAAITVSPPTPKEGTGVFLYTMPDMKVYVRRFGGFAMTAETWERQRQRLLQDLSGKKVQASQFFSAVYNSPMDFENRRNEVWVQSTEGQGV